MQSFDSLGIPDTSLRGLNTRTALRVRKSKSEPTVDRILKGKRQMHRSVLRQLIFTLVKLVSVSQTLPDFLFLSYTQFYKHTLTFNTHPCQVIISNCVSNIQYVNPVRAELINRD